jgi:hypothetical protein
MANPGPWRVRDLLLGEELNPDLEMCQNALNEGNGIQLEWIGEDVRIQWIEWRE